MTTHILSTALREHVTSAGDPKRACATFAEAAAFCETLPPSRRGKSKAYRCGLCGAWHVGRWHGKRRRPSDIGTKGFGRDVTPGNGPSS